MTSRGFLIAEFRVRRREKGDITKRVILVPSITALLLLIQLCCFSSAGIAQGTAGSILGTVRDENGNVITGAVVSVLNEQTGFRRETRSNEHGHYEFNFLPIGQYAVTATSTGFRMSKVPAIKLEVDQKGRVDFVMQIGEIGDNVTVTDAPLLIESETSTIGEVITGAQIVDLPLNGRQFLGLIGLGPGTAPAPRDFRSTEPGGRGVTIPAVNGGRPEDNNYQVDGIDNREVGRANYAISPSVESIAEFKVTTGIMSAEHGRVAGAAVEVVTKSGGNAFHGSAFEFLRNDALDARNFFEKEVSALKRNQFGFSLGGPVVRDKHFFFGAFESSIERSARAPVVGVVPTENMRRGVFSQTIRDPLNNNQPFPNNTIPESRMDSISKRVLEYIAVPNNADPARNFIYTRDSTKQDKYLFTVRTDHALTDKDQLYGRYILDDEQVIEAPQLPSNVGGVNSPVRAQGLAIQETHTFNPATINQASVGWTRFRLQQIDNFAYVKDIAKELGIQLVGLGDDPMGWAFPQISIRGYVTPSGTFPRPRSTDIIQLRDTISITRGNHTIRAGADLRHYKSNNFSPGQLNGAFTFDGVFTGNAFADFLLGWPLQVARNIDPAEQNGVLTYFGAFINDDWKLTSRLTLNLGIRYEKESVLKETEDEVARFDLTTGRVLFPEAIRSTVEQYYQQVRPDVPYGFLPGSIYNPDNNNFAPRIGFALRPFDHNRTVIRGGYGIYYNAPQVTTLLSSVSAPPFSKRPAETSNRSVPQLRWNPVGGLEQAQQGPLTCFCFVQDEFPYSYMQQWALTVQQSILKDMMVEVGYIGSHTIKLLAQPNLNISEPGPGTPQARAKYPQWARIQAFLPSYTSGYNGLTVKVEQRVSRGLSFLAAYTFSKTLDQASTINVSPTSRPDNDLRLENGRADFDVRHRLSFSYSYDLPFGPNRPLLNNIQGLIKHMIGGWGVRGITTFQTGYPLSVTMAASRLNVTDGITPRPDQIRDGNLPTSERTINRWFDTGAFELPPLYTLGTAGRNIVDGPGYNNFDISIFKNTNFTERQRLEFRAEFFNAFNHPNFGLPGSNISTPQSYGVITSASAPRIIQFGLKYYF